ncbi:MAG: hypothetical protein EBR23_13160, partial [Planctomycetia bacterium]|nr:hypothetical protein [Planctomycetia bacterium]
MAPTESRLEATQPQSIINLQTIQNSIAPTADYAMIAALSPSVTNFSTNGPGLNESKPTLRGFTDGQYNVTIDGIPFGDGNDYNHHTTSYFPAKLLPVTRAYFERAAAFESSEVAADMQAVLREPPDAAALARLSSRPMFNALLRTTCVATMLDAGHATNALPQRARAVVNCRILPGEAV